MYRVLIVEDHEPLARLAKMHLEDYADGLHVDVVEDAEDALAHIKAYHYNAVLLDCNLPDSRGSKTFKTLKPYLNGTPAIIYTANKDAAVRKNLKDEMRSYDRLYFKESNSLDVFEAVKTAIIIYAKKMIGNHYGRRPEAADTNASED